MRSIHARLRLTAVVYMVVLVAFVAMRLRA
jgi:hypothetical protein